MRWPRTFMANLSNTIDSTGGSILFRLVADVHDYAVAAGSVPFVNIGSFPVIHSAGYVAGLATSTPWVGLIVDNDMQLFINDGGDTVYGEMYKWRWTGSTFTDYAETGYEPNYFGAWDSTGVTMTTQEFSEFTFDLASRFVSSGIATGV